VGVYSLAICKSGFHQLYFSLIWSEILKLDRHYSKITEQEIQYIVISASIISCLDQIRPWCR